MYGFGRVRVPSRLFPIRLSPQPFPLPAHIFVSTTQIPSLLLYHLPFSPVRLSLASGLLCYLSPSPSPLLQFPFLLISTPPAHISFPHLLPPHPPSRREQCSYSLTFTLVSRSPPLLPGQLTHASSSHPLVFLSTFACTNLLLSPSVHDDVGTLRCRSVVSLSLCVEAGGGDDEERERAGCLARFRGRRGGGRVS